MSVTNRPTGWKYRGSRDKMQRIWCTGDHNVYFRGHNEDMRVAKDDHRD